jgi:hypothetical protein
MSDSSVYGEIARAIPVVIGGILAVGGGVIAQVVTHRLAISRDERNLRRERLESLVKALYAHQQWIEDRFNTMIFKNAEHDIPSPLNEVRMLQILHFPELSTEVCAVLDAQLPLLKFIGDQKVARMNGEQVWLAQWNDKPYLETYESYARLITATAVKCRALLGS